MDLPDFTIFIQIVNFLFLLFILNIIAYRPIRGILAKRREEISSTENITQDFFQKVDKFSHELEQNISETKKEGFKEKENLKNEAIEQEREMLQEAYSSIEEKIAKTKEEIQERVSLARESLQAELDVFSQEFAEKILGRGI